LSGRAAATVELFGFFCLIFIGSAAALPFLIQITGATMTLPAFSSGLEAFLAQAADRYNEVFNWHQALGAIVGCLSTPNELTAAEILELVLNQENDVAEGELANEAISLRWTEILGDVKNALIQDEDWQQRLYPLSELPPADELADWCDGYLQAYLYCEDVWHEFFGAITEMDTEHELDDLPENHAVFIKMLTSFAHWQESLEESPELLEISDSIKDIQEEIFGGVNYFFALSQEMLAALDEHQEQGTVVKDPTPGRNDACPCGSGKKYKKCCLN
jgi:uncharacterized protein